MRLLLALALACSVQWAAAQSVALSGVAGNKALLVIDGAAPRFLSPGQAHMGVTLVQTDGQSATVTIDGQRQTLRVGDAFQVPSYAQCRYANQSDKPTRVLWVYT